MNKITRDSLLTGPAPLAEGERLVTSFRADTAVYLRNTMILIVVFGAVAGLALIWTGNPYPWVGPVAALLGVGGRAWFLASEAFGAEWRLTDRRLLGPAGQIIPRGDIAEARKVLGDVVVIRRSGEKALIKYQSDADAVIATLNGVRA